MILRICVFALFLNACGQSNSHDDNPTNERNNTDNATNKNSDEATGEEPNSGTEIDFSVGALPGLFTSWEQIDQLDPEQSSVTILDGQDSIAYSCSIYLMAITENSAGSIQYIVRSSFSHGGEGHKLFVVPAPTSGDETSIGKNIEDPGQIALEFEGGTAFENVVTANIKWWHRDHFDINRCTNLVLRPQDNSDSGSLLLPPGLTNLEELDITDPEQHHLAKYLGFDPIKRAFGMEDSCHVYLMAVHSQDETTDYYFRSDFNHGGVSHPPFRISWSPQLGDITSLRGIDDRDPDSFLDLDFTDNDPEKATEATIKWLHVDHYHTDQCSGLELQE